MTIGDYVVSFDRSSNLVPGKVARTMTKDVKILLNFFGTHVTPGHVYYRPDSKQTRPLETLIDILRDDGMIAHQDGRLIRAATHALVGGSLDGYVRAITGALKLDGSVAQKTQGVSALVRVFL